MKHRASSPARHRQTHTPAQASSTHSQHTSTHRQKRQEERTCETQKSTRERGGTKKDRTAAPRPSNCAGGPFSIFHQKSRSQAFWTRLAPTCRKMTFVVSTLGLASPGADGQVQQVKMCKKEAFFKLGKIRSKIAHFFARLGPPCCKIASFFDRTKTLQNYSHLRSQRTLVCLFPTIP